MNGTNNPFRLISIKARAVLDSRGVPTVEAECRLAGGAWGRAAVPSGASTGAHEAVELRDGDNKRFAGKGVKKAVEHIAAVIAPRLNHWDARDQVGIDAELVSLDGTANKGKLGANAILAVSLAVAKAAADASNLPLYRYIGGAAAHTLPVPLMNILNGGAHANNGLDVQEFMIAPVCGGSFFEAVRAGSEIFHALKKILAARGLTTAVGDEGGFAPKLASNREALTLVTEAIGAAGYQPGKDIFIALDVASTELYLEDGTYRWEGKKLSASHLAEVYSQWLTEFPIVSIEDGFAEDDWSAWTKFTEQRGSQVQLVGDDLFVTNVERVQKGIRERAANALLVKVNQIGTLTEAIQATQLAAKERFATVMSHRSGETEDVTIADLAVALGSEQIKTGSPCRGERTAKYNQLIRIEEELGLSGRFLGRQAFRPLQNRT